ncbi:hypothetical protein EDD29_3621 [Actinocorallia herbida]|uniref:Uncharacterized protein n=1 Tax=Actinocorallia herbida TaxID=58109 RepID=A0A3N1CXN3_9ACTN|nr:hypothetical protein [Actinocorallia herbida]ROO86060.1 hypothetical protein EDD29_3621 [Actinocorallia herbida]
MNGTTGGKALSAAVIAAVFAVSVAVVVFFVLKGRGSTTTSWALPGATLEDQDTVDGRSDGFNGTKKACVNLKNASANLPARMKSKKVGPKSVYDEDRCDGVASGGRNGVPGLLAQCAEGVVLRPGESCSVGVRLVAEGQPKGEIDFSTEVMCTSRKIEPCRLLRKDLNPTEDKPLALTIDQRAEFPMSDTAFELTTQQAELTATETAPLPELKPEPTVTGPGPETPPTPGVTDPPATPPTPEVTDSPPPPTPEVPGPSGEQGDPGDPNHPDDGGGSEPQEQPQEPAPAS